MNLANKPRFEEDSAESRVRVAALDDVQAVSRLFSAAAYQHAHLTWGSPLDLLDTPGFMLKTAPPRKPSRLMGEWLKPANALDGCLAASADPPPAAWIRYAALAEIDDPIETLQAMFAPIVDHLRASGADQVGWLGAAGWPRDWLTALGFAETGSIQTYLKRDTVLPPFKPVPGMRVRAVKVEELARLAEIERAAYEPLWRLSAASLSQARKQGAMFDALLLEDRLVGYQITDFGELGPHLVRLTIDPALHGAGIGTAFLAHIITGYRELRPRHISLNTQSDNHRSQALYRKFGFQPTSQFAPVYTRPL